MPKLWIAKSELIPLPSAELPVRQGDPMILIGRREWVSFPDLGISPLRAKTDSGARSSSLHAEHIAVDEVTQTVRFFTRDPNGKKLACCAPLARYGRVRSSTGTAEQRAYIETRIRFAAGIEQSILVSLTDRSDMLCPVLIGRRALSGIFFINPAKSYLLGSRKRLG
jgi:hypothetical protein